MTRRLPRAALVGNPRSARRLPVLTTAIAVSSALLLSGCQPLSPIQTAVPYDPGDGVPVSLGDVQIRDLLVISEAKGSAGVISGYILNKGSAPVTVSFAAKDGTPATTVLKAGEQAVLSAEDGAHDITLATVDAAPGGAVALSVSTPAGGTEQIRVPVLLPTGYYEKLTPPASTESAPTESAPTESAPTESAPTESAPTESAPTPTTTP